MLFSVLMHLIDQNGRAMCKKYGVHENALVRCKAPCAWRLGQPWLLSCEHEPLVCTCHYWCLSLWFEQSKNVAIALASWTAKPLVKKEAQYLFSVIPYSGKFSLVQFRGAAIQAFRRNFRGRQGQVHFSKDDVRFYPYFQTVLVYVLLSNPLIESEFHIHCQMGLLLWVHLYQRPISLIHCFLATSPISQQPELSNIKCTEHEVDSLLCSLKVKTSTGSDGIFSHML